jgi:hypothetical protein
MENIPTNGADQDIKTEPLAPEQAPAQSETPEVDYKAELEEAKEKLKKAEFALYKRNVAAKAQRQEQAEEVDIDSRVEETVAKRLTQITNDFTSDSIQSALESITENKEEQDLIKFHYDNSIQRTGVSKVQIFDDMQKAKLLANAPKYLKENKEMQESLKSKRTTSMSSMGANVDISAQIPKNDDLRGKFSTRDWDFMKARGWSDQKIRQAADTQTAFGERPVLTAKKI